MTPTSASAWVAQPNSPGQKHTYQLSIGTSAAIAITPDDNSANSVAAAINAKAGDKVRATVVNVGSNDQPDYRISLQAAKLGPNTLDIKDGAASLQTPQVDGAMATYVVNGSVKADGSPNVVSSASRSVSIAAGLPHRAWIALSGLIALVFGLVVWSELPEGAVWVIGTFVGFIWLLMFVFVFAI